VTARMQCDTAIFGRVMPDDPFSVQLERWLESDHPKTLGRLGEVFKEKAFAIAVLLLMATPALPLPTGGTTHVCEAVAALIGADGVAVAIILEDILILGVGIAVGAGGLILIFTLGAAVLRLLKGLF